MKVGPGSGRNRCLGATMSLRFTSSLLPGRSPSSLLCLARKLLTPSMENFSYLRQSEWKDIPGCFACGKRQSPIDLRCEDACKSNTLRPLEFSAWDCDAAGTLTNNGHTVKFSPDSSGGRAGFTDSRGVDYRLEQFHFHWGRHGGEGSEHRHNGEQFDSEIHFVFKKEAGGENDIDHLSVVGVLCRQGPAHSQVWEQLKIPIECGAKEHVSLSYNELMPDCSVKVDDYFMYEGSLTTPPCSEVVQWLVLSKKVTIPESFLSKLRCTKDHHGHHIEHNFRDIQPLNGRCVYCTK